MLLATIMEVISCSWINTRHRLVALRKSAFQRRILCDTLLLILIPSIIYNTKLSYQLSMLLATVIMPGPPGGVETTISVASLIFTLWRWTFLSSERKKGLRSCRILRKTLLSLVTSIIQNIQLSYQLSMLLATIIMPGPQGGVETTISIASLISTLWRWTLVSGGRSKWRCGCGFGRRPHQWICWRWARVSSGRNKWRCGCGFG